MNVSDSISLFGNKEIVLPAYMNSLSEEDILVVQMMNRKNVILACGIEPKSNMLLCITDSTIIEIHASTFFSKKLDYIMARPVKMGVQIEVHTPEVIIDVDSCDVI